MLWIEKKPESCDVKAAHGPWVFCEMPAGHPGPHSGRTVFGRWRSWPQSRFAPTPEERRKRAH